ncbi:GCN5-related N-acetyltransferase 7, chloroplastic [Physcomitrium patens]|uniref:N-acetyltransferase domain-containing protein n=1 Tax=Physcomitrium patens TaxID=3218 RepID=A0A2K1L6W5_PHYPA|nr:uncharacterized protein LOC112293745 [Physcomitrium patens]PNR61779.1 hypothetical protein PHYPA_000202 [Physcomitrium patens]|eukprot:XP_024399712.1 uncharacterized protein LOC112293745 [Physcomitrella patens]
MSIPTLLLNRGIVVSGPSASVCAPSKLGWKPLPLVRIPSYGLTGRVSRVIACAAPCDSLEVTAPVAGKFEFGSAPFDSSVLQCVRDGLVFQEGRTPEIIRAAAYLRALSFYTYPEGRGEEAIRLHRKMKAEDEFTALTSKVAGLEQGYKRIVCILALYPLSCLPDRSLVDLHPALKVTLANGEEHVLVGSLDLSQGKVLPGEIVGSKPQGSSAERERGYLSNVCVAPLMRQRGIGVALLLQSQKIAQHWGITSLYVHVVVTNDAAVKLYSKGGFILEKEETASEARNQARPRRKLLHKFI